MRVRLASPDDSEAIREIYNTEVLTSTATFDLVPRSPSEQQAWLQARSGVHAVMIAEAESGAVIGFGSLSPYRERPAYSTTVEDSVYVHRDHQGEGVGRAVLGELVDLASMHGFHTVMARIVSGHEASIALHATLGFEQVGTEREIGRKFGRWLDVVVMQRML
ncbi:MAG: N-acetyltransferase family protein [Acidimicrobiales bacterium]|nr:N-acetyltransferase family protein [Acidimicrobiales bacterium]